MPDKFVIKPDENYLMSSDYVEYHNLYETSYLLSRYVSHQYHGRGVYFERHSPDGTPDILYYNRRWYIHKDAILIVHHTRAGKVARLSFEQAENIRARRSSGESLATIHKDYPQVSYSQLSRIANNLSNKE